MKGNKLKSIMQFNKNHIKLLLIIALALFIGILIFGATSIIKYNIEKKEAQELPEMSYKTIKVNQDGKADVIVTFSNENGILEITDFTGNKIYAHGKMKIAIDYKLEDRKNYEFTIKDRREVVKQIVLEYEIPRVNGNYLLVGEGYVNSPDLSGFDERYTRYLYMNNDKLVAGDWITEEPPSDWYDYSEQRWANIYVENEGLGTYLVWIPRYVYKQDTTNSVSGNERTDVKFVSVYNEYKDAITGEVTTWETLQSQGYMLPEAFKFADIELPGYWISKYQLSEITSSSAYTIYYEMTSTPSKITVKNLTSNSDEIASYTYAINGKVVYTSDSPENYSFTNLADGDKTICVTGLDSDGRIVGSFTRLYKTVEVNSPDVSKFDMDTTFYVYYDEDGTEHSDIPISQEPPNNWYDYSSAYWANVVTKANDTTTYWVWIPRYEFSINSTTQRTNINFINGTSTTTTPGYSIPEAFTFAGQELTGYWITKYQLNT